MVLKMHVGSRVRVHLSALRWYAVYKGGQSLTTVMSLKLDEVS